MFDRAREDPRETMSDFEFRKHFRFSKDNVGRISDMLGDDLSFDTNRGLSSDSGSDGEGEEEEENL